MREAASIAVGQHTASGDLGTSIGAALSRFVRSWKIRRRLVRMTDLDDHILEDIGITRGNLYYALSLPYSQDASLELQRIAQMNRAKWRRGF